jgi:hypothetical protein
MSLVVSYIGSDYAAIAGEGKHVVLDGEGNVVQTLGEDCPKFFPLTPHLALAVGGSKRFSGRAGARSYHARSGEKSARRMLLKALIFRAEA